MADILSTLSSNYLAVGSANTYSTTKYVAVDKDLYEGTWSGKYANNSAFTISVSNIEGFRAKAKYQSGSTVKYQDVLIKDNGFRIGDTKFTLTKQGTAQIKSVLSDGTGASTVETAYAKQS